MALQKGSPKLAKVMARQLEFGKRKLDLNPNRSFRPASFVPRVFDARSCALLQRGQWPLSRTHLLGLPSANSAGCLGRKTTGFQLNSERRAKCLCFLKCTARGVPGSFPVISGNPSFRSIIIELKAEQANAAFSRSLWLKQKNSALHYLGAKCHMMAVFLSENHRR